jgi:hypothetical protein
LFCDTQDVVLCCFGSVQFTLKYFCPSAPQLGDEQVDDVAGDTVMAVLRKKQPEKGFCPSHAVLQGTLVKLMVGGGTERGLGKLGGGRCFQSRP